MLIDEHSSRPLAHADRLRPRSNDLLFPSKLLCSPASSSAYAIRIASVMRDSTAKVKLIEDINDTHAV